MRAVTILFVLLAACGSNLPNYNYAGEPDPRSKEVVLGVGDIVAINVWGEGNQGLNTEATIRPDGTITMPLVGDLKAGGETPSTLKATIKGKLTDFVKVQGTEITVALKAWRSYRFTVQGEVVKTGVFTTDQFVTVSDAIALAGGPTRFARRDGIVLLRTDAKTKEAKRIPLDYDLLASGKRVDMNIFVLPGDTIFVP
ncbi:MAG: polysaccharide biosynthesis/export family protein [Myxococcales bacterium]|nr:polysaccharide biosynthesis/export family protein [Myxococcales bacterium]